MRNLELQNFGVQELDAKELVEVDGGFPVFLIALGIYIFDQRARVKQGAKDALYDLTHL